MRIVKRAIRISVFSSLMDPVEIYIAGTGTLSAALRFLILPANADSSAEPPAPLQGTTTTMIVTLGG